MNLRFSSAARTGFLFFILFIPAAGFGQCHKGKVMSSESENGIGYVSIGIVGKNVGTVSDKDGNFSITINDGYDNDTLRFSMIGFEPRCLTVKEFKQDPVKNIYLKPRLTMLDEVKISYCKPKKIRLGEPVPEDYLKSGFDCNELGSEMGIIVETRKKVRLENLNLSVAACTYDSVIYRLNIYRCEGKDLYTNILNKPVYISFRRDAIGNVMTFDLSDYSIIVEGDILITLELFRDLGEGKLLFNTQFFAGSTLHRKTSEGTWTNSPGAIGMYLDSYELR